MEAMESPLPFTAHSTHTFSLERPLFEAGVPRWCGILGNVKRTDLLWFPLKDMAKKVPSAWATPSRVTESCMLCSASRILCLM